MPGAPAVPKKKAHQLTPVERVKWVISLYVKAGAVPEKIPAIAKRASLTVADATRLLKRKTSQQEIKRRMEPILAEQARQKTISEVMPVAKAAMQDELAKTVITVQRLKIQPEILDHRLMEMVLGLDMQRFPNELLNAIKAAYIVNGTMESGNTRLIIPKEGSGASEGQGTYTSLFNRLALNPAPAKAGAQPEASSEIFDLTPRPKQPEAPQSTPLPPPGESIDANPPETKQNSRVITVQVE
jgi:glycerol-3-phosphate cytidylyltransferase-like family protein